MPLSAGEKLTAAKANRLRGKVDNGYAEIVANSNTGTALFDVTGMSITVTVDAGDRYVIECNQGGIISTVSGDTARLNIREGATILAQGGRLEIPVSGQGWNGGSFAYEFTAAGNATRTFKISMERTTGTGNVGIAAGANNPAYISIRRLGS